MLRGGHYGLAMLVYAPMATRFGGPDARLAVLAGVPILLLAARLPDVDRRVPVTSHRGFTHTLWFVALLPLALVAVVAGHISPSSLDGSRWMLSFGYLTALAGGLSHLVGDALTPMGVRPFWPVSDRRLAVGIVRSEDPTVNTLLLLAGSGAMAIVTSGFWF